MVCGWLTGVIWHHAFMQTLQHQLKWLVRDAVKEGVSAWQAYMP
jgi:hypothetical protein